MNNVEIFTPTEAEIRSHELLLLLKDLKLDARKELRENKTPDSGSGLVWRGLAP